MSDSKNPYILRADEVKPGEIVVDKHGSLWVLDELGERPQWRYIVPEDSTREPGYSWDGFDALPEAYEPYTVLDEGACAVIGKWLVAEARRRKVYVV